MSDQTEISSLQDRIKELERIIEAQRLDIKMMRENMTRAGDEMNRVMRLIDARKG